MEPQPFSPESSETGEEKRRGFTVAIFGTGSEKTDTDKKAVENARLLARKIIVSGFSLITGGYTGVMKAANDAAVEELQTQGTQPARRIRASTFQKENLKVSLPEVEGADIRRHESLMQRAGDLIDDSQAFIALSGSVGTTLEILSTIHSEEIQGMRKEASPKPLVIIDPSMKQTDILSTLYRDPKFANYSTLNHVYILSNEPESIEEAGEILEDYYNLSTSEGEEKERLAQEIPAKYQKSNLTRFIRAQREFEEGAGI